jgi:hypothetical protein
MCRCLFSSPWHQLEVSDQLHAPAAFTPVKESAIHIGWQVGWTPKPVWTEKRKFLIIPGLELQPLGRPAHSHTLYRLSYDASNAKGLTRDNYRTGLPIVNLPDLHS